MGGATLFEQRRQKPRRPRKDPVLDKVLDDVLNSKVPVIPGFADLPRRWREAPSTASDRMHPTEPTQEELLLTYLSLAFTQPLAREGLDSLYGELVLTGQPIPCALSWWTAYVHLVGDPPANRGRPREIDRDIRVGTMHKLLGTCGYTREGAIRRIAKTMHYSEDAIRTIIRKHKIKMEYPSGPGNN